MNLLKSGTCAWAGMSHYAGLCLHASVVLTGDKRTQLIAPMILESFNFEVAKLGETIFVSCQFCRRVERREAKSASRVVTCFECRAERVRRTSRQNYRLRRAASVPAHDSAKS